MAEYDICRLYGPIMTEVRKICAKKGNISITRFINDTIARAIGKPALSNRQHRGKPYTHGFDEDEAETVEKALDVIDPDA